MARRKSVCAKWTLVLVSIILCPVVLSRPQEDPSLISLSSIPSSATEKSTEIPIRYRFRSSSNLSTFVSPVTLSFPNNFNLSSGKFTQGSNYTNIVKSQRNDNIFTLKNRINNFYTFNPNINETHRRSRLIRNNSNNLGRDATNRVFKTIPKSHLSKNDHLTSDGLFTEKNKPIIRKVITKWTDKTRYEDLDFSTENINSAENSKEFNQYSSREDVSSDESELSKDNHPKLTKKVYYKPKPQYSQAFPIYPSNVQAMESYQYTPTRPTYVFATPTPTPVITNVGYPPPWQQPNFQVIQPVTSQRPIRVTNPVRDHYNHHSIVNNYPQQYPSDNFEVTTFQPTSAYTDRIVIRPEEYSASPDDCPTIYLTLNNTFQGQAKEACPDLNIAVNTNVVNKNVVVESEEESDNSFADAFGIPLMDDSESAEVNNDYNESADEEGDAESASIEGTALTNYNSNTGVQESAESGEDFECCEYNLTEKHITYGLVKVEVSSNPTMINISNEDNKEKEPSATLSIKIDTTSLSRDVKNKTPATGDSIKKVTGQLAHKINDGTVENPVIIDTRIPPKLKNQLKHRIKTRNEDGEAPIENSHAGIAVPITMEELESENIVTDVPAESSTSNEGISTWILLNNPVNKESNSLSTTEPAKVEDPPKKQKTANSKNKTKRPPNNKVPKRPVIGSTNKSDLVAGGSAINENVYNKLKDTILSNVQKNKITTQRTTTTTSTTQITTTEPPATKKETNTKTPILLTPVVKITSKPAKKKNKNKVKVSTSAPIISESALLPMEAKEQEIEIEVSTPVTTTKKPKRTSTRKKNKTKKRKTTKPKTENSTAIATELKTANKTKSSKQPKPASSGPITTQIYNYFSREVMPTVGVGVIGLASLVGIASYFLYPFASPVRRTFEVDKKDDIYKHNAEEYANEGNGQAEEEMLGTVLAGMPTHAKHKINPYAAQTPHVNRYPTKKEQDLRYRHVQHASAYDPHYKVHYAQQKTGIAHGAVYPEPLNYRQQYETRHAYTTENKYEKSTAYTPYPAVEPIYAAPQSGPSGISSYGSESANSVVYGVKPSPESDFKPVYPFDGQFYGETTSHPVTYAPTSMYLGSNNEADETEDKYGDGSHSNLDVGMADNKFVVGNVPKEFNEESATPAVVPEHGPRSVRRRRNVSKRRAIIQSLDDILKSDKDDRDIFLSNEIDEIPHTPGKYTNMFEMMTQKKIAANDKDEEKVVTVYATSADLAKDVLPTETSTTAKNDVVESVSTVPVDHNNQETDSIETEIPNDVDMTTKTFKVYEVFTSNPSENSDKSSPLTEGEPKDTVTSKDPMTTQVRNMNTETTTEFKSETTSTMPPSPSPITEPKPTTTFKPKPTYGPEVITYPPLNQDGGFFGFLKRLVEFKYRLGLSILQTTSDSLNRYLRSMENSAKSLSKSSHK